MKKFRLILVFTFLAFGGLVWYSTLSQSDQTVCMRIRDCHFPEKGPTGKHLPDTKHLLAVVDGWRS